MSARQGWFVKQPWISGTEVRSLPQGEGWSWGEVPCALPEVPSLILCWTWLSHGDHVQRKQEAVKRRGWVQGRDGLLN